MGVAPQMTRFGVTKHGRVLGTASLITTAMLGLRRDLHGGPSAAVTGTPTGRIVR